MAEKTRKKQRAFERNHSAHDPDILPPCGFGMNSVTCRENKASGD